MKKYGLKSSVFTLFALHLTACAELQTGLNQVNSALDQISQTTQTLGLGQSANVGERSSYPSSENEYTNLGKWQALSEQGNADAQNELGVMYSRGKCIDKDDKKAFLLFYKSASQENILGQANLALAYYEGRGANKNGALAKKWISKACDKAKATNFVEQVKVCNEEHTIHFNVDYVGL